MAYYFKSRRLDIRTEDPLIFLLNEATASEKGLSPGARVHLCWHDICVYGTIDTTNTLVGYDELGLYEDVWLDYGIPSNDMVTLDVVSNAKSVEAIEKKLLGGTLNYQEIHQIIEDIAKRKLTTVETTYFAASSYAPGFNDQEIYYMTKAMAETGDMLNFDDLGKKVVDKHSIGGIPAKGVTPVMVPILACFDLIVPNTSSRAITSPAGTSDILECIMPVALSKSQIDEVVRKTNACLVWGGGVDLAPADDVLINIERALHIESYDKFVVSIMAKKIATGIHYFLVDLPVGPGTKIKKEEDIPLVSEQFRKLGELFDIKVDVYQRRPKGPDGNGVGPILEARDLLFILERDVRRPLNIENLALDMAGKILEITKTVDKGQGFNSAKEVLENGKAAEKFWEIAFSQGAKTKRSSSDFVLGDNTQVFNAPKTGTIKNISNKTVVQTTRILGAPFIKLSGIYFDKLVGEQVTEGEPLFTLYATDPRRLWLAQEFLAEAEEKLIEIE
ncbi:thymidine phosphorylase [Candidatus Dojkabacteria bacterium]|nr:thymidine phosphorylase [Candidatus Dojkabacteria bacterium]